MGSVQKLNTAICIIIIGFLVAVVFHSIMSYLGYGYPFNTFLFKPNDRFMDFYNVYQIDLHLDPYFSDKYKLAAYFPFCYLVFYPFTFFSPLLAFIIFTWLFCGFLFWFMCYTTNKVMPRFTLFFLSYPVLFCLDRSNIDNLIFVIVGLFIVFFESKKYLLSALLLAIAVSMKVYPMVFLVLLMKDRRWKECVYTVIMTVVFTLFALTLFKTGNAIVNYNRLSDILALFNNMYFIGDSGIYFTNSLFQLLKLILWHQSPFNNDSHYINAFADVIAQIEHSYFFFVAGLFALIALYVVFIETVRWKQVMLLVVPMILFPYLSEDYKLIFLFIPFFLFISSVNKDKFDRFYTILFALIFIPKNYFLFEGPLYYRLPQVSVFSIMSVINISIMSLFVLHIMRHGLIAYVENKKSRWMLYRLICQPIGEKT